MKEIYNNIEFKVVAESRSNIHITHHKEFKMKNIDSISTSVLENEICKQRRTIEGSVCEYCYAAAQLDCYENQRELLKLNTKILTENIITEVPLIGTRYARFESFGELNNTIQAINYLNIARFNPETNFGWWTKNLMFIKKAIELGWEKPNNLIIVYSSLMMDEEEDYETIKLAFPFVDKIFTVYDEDNGNINCGGKSCIECLDCYKDTDVIYVRELVKQRGYGSRKSNKRLLEEGDRNYGN